MREERSERGRSNKEETRPGKARRKDGRRECEERNIEETSEENIGPDCLRGDQIKEKGIEGENKQQGKRITEK